MSFIYGSEIIRTSLANFICSFYNGLDGCTMMFASIYFKYLSKEWISLYEGMFALCLVCTIGSFFLPESPRYLICKGQFLEAVASYNYIARFNRNKELKPGYDRFIEELCYEKIKTSPQFGGMHPSEEGTVEADISGISMKSDFWSMFSIKSYAINLLMMSIAWASSSFT
jgi:hypothetical protein